MAKKRVSTKKTLSKVFGILVAVILVITAVGVVVFYTNSSNSYKKFYIMHEETAVNKEISNLSMPLHSSMRFDCVYDYDWLVKDKTNGYKINIIPNVSNDNDFVFTVDGEFYNFSSIASFTDCFDIEYYDTYFIVNITKDMQDILKAAFFDSEVIVPNVDFTALDYFTLFVYSYDNNCVITINFHCGTIQIEDITLDTGSITFYS